MINSSHNDNKQLADNGQDANIRSLVLTLNNQQQKESKHNLTRPHTLR